MYYGMDELIASHYKLVPHTPPMAVGGLAGYVVTDQRDPARTLLAVQTRPDMPPRARLLGGRAASAAPNVLMPLDYGAGRDPSGRESLFVLTALPPGLAIAADPRPWSEADIMRCLLQPAAAALDALAERGVSHRAIRPDNIFRAGPGERVVLGPCWATPPASLQPAAFEPPYSAQCLPCGRGEGSPYDDVYALGVTILWCVLGGAPGGPTSFWEDEVALLRRKLTLGSLPALADGARLSQSLTELLRGMLAEDPDHRPSPALLLDPEQARSRRVATRPIVRAQRALEVGPVQVWYPRELAWAIGKYPDDGAKLVRNGTLGAWLRRILGDSQIALRLDDAMARAAIEAPAETTRPAHVMASRAVAALDPLAPMIWRGIAVFPDGLATAMAQAALNNESGTVAAALEEVLIQDVTAAWLGGRIPRPDYTRMQQDVRDWRDWLSTRGIIGGIARVLYGGNPMMSCASPILAGRVVVKLVDLLPALEEVAATTDRKRPPIDTHIAAFIAARADQAMLLEAKRLNGFASPEDRLAVISLLNRLQQRHYPEKLPRLAGWVLESGLVDLTVWRSLPTRKSLQDKLTALAAKGAIAPILELLQDSSAKSRDAAGAYNAGRRVTEIDAVLENLRGGAERRADRARQTGIEIATGLSLLSLLGGAITVALAG
jgi:hypothetical protein